MDLLAVLTWSYGALQNYGAMPYWVLSPLRRLIRIIANKYLPAYLSKPVQNNREVEKDLIISLTSFPARINNVWMVIETLKRQTVLPEKIILWLSKEQFPNNDDIPDSLKQQVDSLFEIRMVDENLRSHKKYFYTISEYPDKNFITCDDDVFYDPNMIRRLVETSRSYSGSIIANHTHKIAYNREGEISSYANFVEEVTPLSSKNLIQIGIGGVLYPSHSLHELVIKKDIFMKLTPLADDIWLNAMARLKGTLVVQSYRDLLTLPITDDSPSLSSENIGKNNMNDIQINDLRQWLKNEGLPDVYSIEYS